MRVLHVVGNRIEAGNGIGRLIPEMISMQNEISSGISSSLLLLERQDELEFDFKTYFYKEAWSDVFPKNFDLVIFHGIYFVQYIKIARALRRLGVPYAVKPHSSLVRSAQKKSFIKKSIFNFLFFSRFLNSSSAILFTSLDEKNNSVNYPVGSFVEPNGLYFEQVSEKPKGVGRKIKFIYLGRIDFIHKGIDYLLNALFVLKCKGVLESIQFDFYGRGHERDEQRLVKGLKKLDADNVKFHGPAFGHHKHEALANADVFVLTSRYEGVPMAILEAMSYSLPCLVTPGTNVSSVIENNDAGWLVSLNSEEIALAVESILESNRSIVASKGDNARRYMLSFHTWDRVVLASELIYSEILRKVSS